MDIKNKNGPKVDAWVTPTVISLNLRRNLLPEYATNGKVDKINAIIAMYINVFFIYLPVESPQRECHPQDDSNLISRLIFLYTVPLFAKGLKSELKEEDIYDVPKNYKSAKLVQPVLEKWNQLKVERNDSIFRLLWSCFGPYYLGIGIFKFLAKTAVLIFQPLALSKIVAYFVTNQKEISKSDVYFYSLCLITVKLFFCICEHNSGLWVAALSIRIRAALYSLIYRKILKIDLTRLGNASVGKLVAYITKDIETIGAFLEYGNDIWSSLLRTVVVFVIIYLKIGNVCLIGIAALFIIFLTQIFLTKRIAYYEKKTCELSEVRYRILKEALSKIKLVKMNQLEDFFKDKITRFRRKEIFASFAILVTRVAGLLGAETGATIAQFIILVTYSKLGNQLNSQIIFFVITSFRMIINNFSVLLPRGLYRYGKMHSSLKRINVLLKLPELELRVESNSTEYSLELKNVSVFVKEEEIIKNLTLKLNRGFVIVSGGISLGKTTLLKTILGEYKAQGYLNVKGTISYASQDPWLFSSTIRQNILFGEQYEEKRYHQVLRICALYDDCQRFDNGDLTLVQDNGVNLSQGQRVRINLARALYRNSDIYLLDSLQSLDSKVSRYILKQISVFLQNKLVILVSQNKKEFKYADKIIVLDRVQIRMIKPESQPLPKLEDTNEETPLRNFYELEEEEKEEKSLLTKKTTEEKICSEEIKSGVVNANIYYRFITSGGGLTKFFLAVFACFAIQACMSYNDTLVRNWSNLEDQISKYANSTNFEKIKNIRDFTITLYGLMLLVLLPYFLQNVYFILFTRKAFARLHKQMLNVFGATMNFYDSYSIGNLLNRFSVDFKLVDEDLPIYYIAVMKRASGSIGVLVIVLIVNTFFTVPVVIMGLVLFITRRYYLKTSRNLSRLNCATKSPLVSYLNFTLDGLTTIRASKSQAILIEEFDRHQDLFTSVSYTLQSSVYAFCLLLDLITLLFIVTLLAKFLFFNYGKNSAGDVGLALSQSLVLTFYLLWGTRCWTEIENLMTSVERILEFADTKQENKQGIVINGWPSQGQIEFKSVNFAYPINTTQTLQNLNFVINSGEKVAIVGRTGAGKSSIFSLLVRLYDFDGQIFIDNVDIKTVGLESLRSSVSVIPQDVVLFTGTVRENLDPKEESTDETLWQVIESVNLSNVISNLDSEIIDNGAHFSSGQKQLFSVARALISKKKIVLIDEATTNLDEENISLFHDVIKKNFSSTVLIITHDLSSILNCDRAIVLKNGVVIRSGTPKETIKYLKQ